MGLEHEGSSGSLRVPELKRGWQPRRRGGSPVRLRGGAPDLPGSGEGQGPRRDREGSTLEGRGRQAGRRRVREASLDLRSRPGRGDDRAMWRRYGRLALLRYRRKWREWRREQDPRASERGLYLRRKSPRLGPGVTAELCDDMLGPRRIQSSASLTSRSIGDGSALEYTFESSAINWWSRTGSNRRPLECHSSALPAELRPHLSPQSVGRRAREAVKPVTSWIRSV